MSKLLDVRAVMFEVIGSTDVSFNLNTYANLGILSLSTDSLEATFMLQGSHESFSVDTMYGTKWYDSDNGDVWDVPAIKAAIAGALQATQGTT